ncbi:ABC transporter substrate-binding protein [uncultured Paracoccus sp.]|uniref:ABC transporter substrate-binding protein n=1 Tax=uncultured Paracoccus sp. TaxID=189685 RepID=UPI002628480B|nr:ABC transporter substrate-binding protein [uncultured Paracoccus sp.]
MKFIGFARSAVTIAALCGSVTLAVAEPKLVEAGKLSIGSDMTYPPFVYLADEKPTGFDVDVMEAIASRMGLPTDWVDTRFAALIPGIRAGHFDIIASALYVTEERQQVLSFVPYTKAGSSIMVLASAADKPASISDLCGKTVSSIRGASWIPKLADSAAEECDGQTIEVREFDTDAQATQALRAGGVDAQFIDNVVAAEVVARQGEEFEVTSTEVLYPVLVAFAVLPENTELLDAVNTALAEIRADGTFEEIRARYGMAEVTDEEIAEIVGANR